ncbi:hypothetical protein [uncultured Roseibium sp.]|uniref:hypothetical protein n=1 Tax=uncultured Roseibium sp. TaxID=1936171 RepID=UPI00260DB37A|nr:hypothetical protein [uncultured Roseibium sp.]
MPINLTDTILECLKRLEEEEKLVITTTVPQHLGSRICETIANEVPIPPISKAEFTAIRALIRQAVEDKRFFDAEMPTLTGLTADAFIDLAERLPIE